MTPGLHPKVIFLQPGDWFVGGAGCRVHTVLGSCVSIVLWHPAARVGAMSHCLLARRGDGVRGQADGRYCDEALALMLRGLATAGAPVAGCQAKLFGGGNMFRGQAVAGLSEIGRGNGETARALLHEQHIPIVSESLFGFGHRTIVFDVGSGDVWVQQVDSAAEVSWA
ncbi:MAG: chemoreceptor glutamine deamidase CheD [Rhodanobacter sp.]